jgi:hypothetical protein
MIHALPWHGRFGYNFLEYTILSLSMEIEDKISLLRAGEDRKQVASVEDVCRVRNGFTE